MGSSTPLLSPLTGLASTAPEIAPGDTPPQEDDITSSPSTGSENALTDCDNEKDIPAPEFYPTKLNVVPPGTKFGPEHVVHPPPPKLPRRGSKTYELVDLVRESRSGGLSDR